MSEGPKLKSTEKPWLCPGPSPARAPAPPALPRPLRPAAFLPQTQCSAGVCGTRLGFSPAPAPPRPPAHDVYGARQDSDCSYHATSGRGNAFTFMDTRHDFLPATVSSVCCFRKFTLMNGLPGREATGALEETLRAWTALASGQASRRAQGLTARDADGGSGGGHFAVSVTTAQTQEAAAESPTGRSSPKQLTRRGNRRRSNGGRGGSPSKAMGSAVPEFLVLMAFLVNSGIRILGSLDRFMFRFVF